MRSRIVAAAGARDPRSAGNKAARLADLRAAGFHVPDFFVVTAGAGPGDLPAPATVAAALRAIGGQGLYAVRSSAADEDAAGHTHAGMYESFLGVAACDVRGRIGDVRRSGAAERLQSYRAARGLDGGAGLTAVIVQRMVDADTAGVAFAVDPVSGRSDRAVVAAVRGLGDRLVGGSEQGDSWRVDAAGGIRERDCIDADRPVLNDRQIRRVADLARRVSRTVGRPQDIEWACRGRRLYLLQSRDIALPADAESAPAYALWDNSNIVESYGGVTTPMTYSVARAAYADAYRHMGRVIGVSERAIREHDADYEQMIGLVDGRVYYNLLCWYRLLMLIPGFRYNRRFMEMMMGVTSGLPDGVIPDASGGRFDAIRSAAGLARVGLRLARRLFGHARRVRRFHARVDRALAGAPSAGMTAAKLCEAYDELQREVVPAWDTPLVNDLYCMLFHGWLRNLCKRWLPAGFGDAHNELLRGESALISLEPLERMRRMAAIVRGSPDLAATLEGGTPADLAGLSRTHPAFAHEYAAYLARFGDRCIDELELASPVVSDDPSALLNAVLLLARNDRASAATAVPDSRRATERRVVAAIRGPARRLVFRVVLARARAAVRDRENLRFERTRVYGRVRWIVLEIGRRLAELGVLDRADDVFYLELRELQGCVRGTGCSAALSDIARLRRQEFDGYRAAPAPPRRFLTMGPPQLATSRRPVGDATEAAAPGDFSAQGCSPGVARGPARIVRDPRRAAIQSGDILVAERTDPGWVTLFPAAAGIVMERGSLLSHTAIVARELGLPCVVGAAGACDRIRDGEWLEIDGGTGSIRRVGEAA